MAVILLPRKSAIVKNPYNVKKDGHKIELILKVEPLFTPKPAA